MGGACQAARRGLLVLEWTRSRPGAGCLVDRVCPPAFAAFNHMTRWPDIFLGVMFAVEPSAPPHSDIACETLPGSHGYPLLLQLRGPSVHREMRNAPARGCTGSKNLCPEGIARSFGRS